VAIAASFSAVINQVVRLSRPYITTTISGRYTVAPGRSICIMRPGPAAGPVMVDPRDALSPNGAALSGKIALSRAAGLCFCRTTITGRVAVPATAGPVVIGGGHGGTVPGHRRGQCAAAGF